MGTLIRETFVQVKDEDHFYGIGENDWYEPFTDNRKKLFQSLQKEWGRCVSLMFRNIAMGDGTYDVRMCGWVFQKKVQYTDCKDKYLREVWVEIKESVL